MDRRSSEPEVVVDGIEAPGGLAFLAGRLAAGRLRRRDRHRAHRARYPQAGPDPLRPEDRRAAALRRRADDGQRRDAGPRRRGLRVQRCRPRHRPRARRPGDQRPGRPIASSNGLVVDTTGTWLYAAQTFVPAAISRVELADPAVVETWYTAPAADSAAGLDGLTRDAHDRLYVAANLGGEVWRVQDDGPGLRARAPAAARPERRRLRQRRARPGRAPAAASAAATSTSSPSRAS